MVRYVIEVKGQRICPSFESYLAAWNYIVRENLNKPNGLLANGVLAEEVKILEKFSY
jgi:hypothetical protein